MDKFNNLYENIISERKGVDNTHILKELENEIKEAKKKKYYFDRMDAEYLYYGIKEQIERVEGLVNSWASGGGYLFNDFNGYLSELEDIVNESDEDYTDEDRILEIIKEMEKSYKKLHKEMKNMKAM
jgi:hypothetical protein